ncbi:MAG: HDOD domain-containing protein [Pseudomonadota bacterium]
MTATTHRSAPQSPLSKPRNSTAGFYSQIFHEIQTGKVPLPSLPHLALQLRSAVSDPNSGFETISRIIQTDPGVASYLLKLANSPAFAARHKAGDLASAINRMGTGSLVNVVTTYCLRQLFRSRSPALRDALREVWVRSARLGATCAVISREVTRQNADRALLAGLLSNIGALPLIRAVAERVNLNESPQMINEVLEQYGRQVGVMMLTNWGFDEWLIDAVRNYRQWHYVSDEKKSYTDLMLVADLLLKKSVETTFVPPSLNTVPAVSRFMTIWPDVDWTPALIEQLEQQVRETEADLSG